MPRVDLTGLIVFRPERSAPVARLWRAPGRVADACSGRQSFGNPQLSDLVIVFLNASPGAASTSDDKQLFAERHYHIARAAEKTATLYAPQRAQTQPQSLSASKKMLFISRARHAAAALAKTPVHARTLASLPDQGPEVVSGLQPSKVDAMTRAVNQISSAHA